MGPHFPSPACSTCVYLDSFGGSDWYLCVWGYPGSLVRVRSVVPHDIEVRVAGTFSGGPWLRAFNLAISMGLIRAPKEK